MTTHPGFTVKRCFILLIFLLPAGLQAQWSPTKSPIMTIWGEALKADSVLPEYPRPQMVREIWLNLNGKWAFSLSDTSLAAAPEFRDEILVPFCVESTLGGLIKKVTAADAIWYSRELPVALPEEGQLWLLHFGAVDWHCRAWVNDVPVGEHYGGYDPFSFDITPALKKKGPQVLTLRVWDPTDEGLQPAGKQVIEPGSIWYTPVSGIWQTVWMEKVPALHISGLEIIPDVDAGTVKVRTVLADPGTDSGLIENVSVRIKIMDDSVVTGSGELNVAEVKSGGSLIIPLPGAKLWSPDSPFLYGLEAELIMSRKPESGPTDENRTGRDRDRKKQKRENRAGGNKTEKIGPVESGASETGNGEVGRMAIHPDTNSVLDRVSGYFGMRKVEIRKDKAGFNRIFLNGEPLFNFGTLDQGWWPDGLYTAPSDEALKYDIEVTKSLGFNTARKHTKVEPERWYYWCDKLGLLVWQDMPKCDGWLSPYSGEDARRPPEQELIYFREWESIIRALDQHPSIICWVPFNEGWGQFHTNDVLEWTKELDPTRLVDGPSGWTDFGGGDMLDLHYYPGPGIAPLQEDRAVVLGEFGGLKYAWEGHLWQKEKSWGYQETESPGDLMRTYEGLLGELAGLVPKGLAAGIYTQTSDVEIEVNGLMTYDRRIVKLDPERAKKAASALYGKPPVYSFILSSAEQADSMEWRYTTLNPEGDWYGESFEDGTWPEGQAGFGFRGYFRIFGKGTDWDTTGLWLRREFELGEIPQGRLLLNYLSHNCVSAVYVNGLKLAVLSPTKDIFATVDFDHALKSLLRPGRNLIAVYCYSKDAPLDEGSGHKLQFADFGLIEEKY